MAKKDFSAAPLMNFITPAAPEAPAEAAEGREPAAAINDTPETEATPNAPGKPLQGKPAKEDNCITPADERARIAKYNAQFRAAPPTPPEYRAKEDHTEPRSRRVQLLLKPSIFDGIKTIAHWKRQSINNLMEEILAEYLNSRDSRGRRK